MLSVSISPNIIATVIEIPRGQETWFEGFKFDMEPCKEFMNPEYADMDLNNAIPISCIKDTYPKLLLKIQRYFVLAYRSTLEELYLRNKPFASETVVSIS